MDNEYYCPVKIEYGGRKRIIGVSFHFGDLFANPKRLRLKAPLLGELIFLPSDVIRLRAFVIIPVLRWGVIIEHVKTDCAQVVRVSHTFMKPQNLIKKITEAGFIPSALRTDNCLACGQPLPEGADKCSKCGWTYDMGL